MGGNIMKARDNIFWVHLISGVVLGAVILVMALTGTALAFRHQIIAWAEKDVYRSSFSGGQQPMTVAAIIASVKESYPKAKVSGLSLKADPSLPMTLSLGREKTLYIDPYSGKVLGEGSKAREVLHFIEDLHRHLAMEGKAKPWGTNIQAAANLAFLLMIITGVILWWPVNWRWNTLKNIVLFNPKAKGRARDWNWHNVIGLWMAPFLLIISVTGVIMSYTWANDALYRITGNQPPPAASSSYPTAQVGGKQEVEERKPVTDWDLLVERSKQQIPGWVSITLRSGKVPSSTAVTIEERPRYIPVRSQLTLDSKTAEVLKWEPASAQNSGRIARTWARYLHTGEAFGLFGQFVAMTAALGAVLLVWTGFVMAWYRFFPKRAG